MRSGRWAVQRPRELLQCLVWSVSREKTRIGGTGYAIASVGCSWAGRGARPWALFGWHSANLPLSDPGSWGPASAEPSVHPLRRVDLGEQSEEGGSQTCPVSGAPGNEDSWLGLEGRSRAAGLLCSCVGCSRVTCGVGLRKPVCAVTPAVCGEGRVGRHRQDPLGELPAAGGSLLPPRSVRCTKVRFSPHLTRPGEGQAVSDPVCTKSCECLFCNENRTERTGSSRSFKFAPTPVPREAGTGSRCSHLSAHLGSVSSFPLRPCSSF